MNNQTINQEVNITALYFQNGPELGTFPRRMEWKGDTITFREGLQKLIGKVRIFIMSDGQQQYRLMSDSDQSNWTLVNISR